MNRMTAPELRAFVESSNKRRATRSTPRVKSRAALVLGHDASADLIRLISQAGVGPKFLRDIAAARR